MIRSIDRRRLLIAIGGALFAAALVLGFVWNPLQRQLYEAAFDAATGSRLHVGSLDRTNGRTILGDLTIDAAGGGALIHATRIAVSRDASGAHVGVEGGGISVVLGRDTLHRMKGLLRGIAFVTGSTNVSAALTNATLQLSRDGSAAPPLKFSNFSGTISITDGVVDVEARAVVNDGARNTPVVFSGGHAHAGVLSLTPVAALLPPSSLAVESGVAQSLDVTWTGGFSAGAGMSGVRGTYDGHIFRGMHGTLLLSSDGIATRNLTGRVDEIPVSISGELHDVRAWNDALRIGTPSLRGLARAYAMISPTQHLHYIKLETTAPGVTYAQYSMMLANVPRVVQFVTIDPHEKTLHFDTALSENHLISKGERTSEMGIRTHAIAGLNGDYFDIGATYQPQGMFIKSGRLFRGPTDREALIIDRSNNVYFSEFRLHGAVTIGNRTLPVTQYNNWPLGYVTIVTPDFGHSLAAVEHVRFLSLQYVRGDRYRVTAVTRDALPSPLTFGVAIGPAVKNLLLPAAGDEIQLRYRIEPFVQHAIAGIGGGPLLLRGGKWFEDPHAPAPDERDVRWPVDALGVMNDRSLIMVAVDGRHPERSGGMTRPEFGTLLQQLGVTDAMALDSGGSVTLVARSPGDNEVTLHNVPSDDDAERYVSNALFLYSSAPAGSLLQSRTTASAGSSN